MRTSSNRYLPAVWCALWLLCASHALADGVDDYVRTEMANQRIPGVAVAIVRGGKAPSLRSYGVANVETGARVTPDTVFRIASLSKQLIATGVMLLVEDGKIALDDGVAQHIADVPPAWRPITVRELLTHTSGLRRESPGFDALRTQPVVDLVRNAYDAPLAAKPGEQFLYSNLGYYVLAEILTLESGEHWSDFLHDRIFGPLGMDATRETSVLDIVPNRADGYVYRDGVLHNAPPLIAARPSGGLLSSLSDLVKWDAALRAKRVLAPADQELMWTSGRLASGAETGYGFGFWSDEVAGHRRIRHGGDNPGFRAEYTRFPDADLSVIVLANGDSARPDAMALQIADRYVHGLSPHRKTTRLDAGQLASYAGRYEISPDNVLTIEVDGDGLSVQSSAGGAQYKLVPEARDVFFISQDETYTFEMRNGTAIELAIRAGAQELRARRLP